MKSLFVLIYITFNFCSVFADQNAEDQLRSLIQHEEWPGVVKYFEEHGTYRYGKYEIELAPQCWQSVEDVKAEAERQANEIELAIKGCFEPNVAGAYHRVKCITHLKAPNDLCRRGGKSAICPDENCGTKQFGFLPVHLQDKFAQELSRAVELEGKAQPSTRKSEKAVERYEDSKAPECAWYYFLPEIKGVAMNEETSAIMAKKAGVTPKQLNEAIAQGQRWSDYAFDESPFQRKPVAPPKFFYGTLNPTGLTPEQLVQQFGKDFGHDMSLQMIPSRVQVRFTNFAGKPPCGDTVVKYGKITVKKGVLVFDHPSFFPAKRGQ